MINAKEAKKRADSILNIRDENELIEIERNIVEAAERGLHYIYRTNISISAKNKKYLEDLGYSVKHEQTGYNETTIKISWGE